MENLKRAQEIIAALENSISLRQIGIRSGINYVTLFNIKKGKSQRVTDAIFGKLKEFQESFKPDAAAPLAVAAASPKKRGRKPGSTNKPKAVTAAPAVAAPAAVPAAAPAAAPKKRGRKPGSKAKAAAKKAAKAPDGKKTMVKPDLTAKFIGETLQKEIEIAEAHLQYLKSLLKAEEEYLKALGL